jgi:predicted kinase
MNGTLVVLIGISGSGKSRLANELTEFEVVSSDEIRKEMLGDVNNQDRGGEIFNELEKRIRQKLAHGKQVIWDSTNLNWSRTKKGAYSYALASRVFFVFFMDSLDFDLCKKRVHNDLKSNVNRSAVPDEVIWKQHCRFKQCLENAQTDPEDPRYFLYDGNARKLLKDMEELEWADAL